MQTEDLLEVCEYNLYDDELVAFDVYESYLFSVLFPAIFSALFFFNESEELFFFD